MEHGHMEQGNVPQGNVEQADADFTEGAGDDSITEHEARPRAGAGWWGIVALVVAIVIVVTVVHAASGDRGTPAAEASHTNNLTITSFDLAPSGGALPTLERMQQEFPGDTVISVSSATPHGRLTLETPKMKKYSYTVFGACLGSGAMNAYVESGTQLIVRLGVPCDGHVRPGWGFGGDDYRYPPAHPYVVRSDRTELPAGTATQWEIFVLLSPEA